MSDFSYSKHAHEEYSLGVTLEGRQDFFYQDSYHKSPAGGVMLFNPEAVHDGHSGLSQPLRYSMLYIHPNEIQPLFKAVGVATNHVLRFDKPLVENTQLRQYILNMYQLIHQQNSSKIEHESALLDIATELVKVSGQRVTNIETRRNDTLLNRAKNFVQENLSADISIDDIASSASMSKYHFIRAFKHQFGITPHQYVVNCRVNQARNLLLQGLSLQDVSFHSGFSDHSHLNRHFKRVFGITPKQLQTQLFA
ncbi:AraC family transcriptional regulator [Vibrio sp.]|nr:AraC family transcriptional regulator [Vibrio sp.]